MQLLEGHHAVLGYIMSLSLRFADLCVCASILYLLFFFFFQAEDGIRDSSVTGVQTCALPICECRGVEDDAESVLACIFRPLSVQAVRADECCIVRVSRERRDERIQRGEDRKSVV